jgi:YebC/PmpR family DNA-binding regulatory protein
MHMSGHSKWSTIKHKKASLDAKRGKEFSKLAKLIAVESKLCGGDESSPSLKAVIEKAKSANMPKDNIARAVAKGAGGDAGDTEKIVYEMYGPGGTAMLIATLTDNRNRTNQELKHLVSKMGYQMAEPGAASWAFTLEGAEYTPTTTVPLPPEDTTSLETLVEALLDHDDVDDVYTNNEAS